MKNKIAAVLLLTALLIGLPTSCARGLDGTETDTTAETDTSETSVSVADIGKAIEEEFGSDYAADTDIDSEILDLIYGVKPEWVAEVYAKQAAMGYNGDLFIAIHASDGHADDVEAALTDYADYNINSAVQYPANQPKINASRVYRKGDYVFYIILGVMDYEKNNDTNYKTAEEFNNRAVKIIDSMMNG